MKTCKKALAILLAVLMALSCTVLSASAEDPETGLISASISGVTAIAFDAKDPETVLKLQMNVSSSETLDAFNPDAQIAVYEDLYITAYTFIAQYLEKSDAEKQAIKADALIATLKPVAFEDGVLTLDVFSKDGTAGAKMINFTLPFLEIDAVKQGINIFLFEFPQGTLSNKSTEAVSAAFSGEAMVAGLASREVRLPSWAEKIVTAFFSGNAQALVRYLPLVPIIILFAPLFLGSIMNKLQKVYNVYGIKLNGLSKDISKVIRKLIPILMSQFK